MWERVIVILCATVVGFSFKAHAIHCFLCESAYEEKCGEEFEMETHFKFDCGRVPPPRYLEHDLAQPNATGCMKKHYSENGVQKIIRSCFFGDVNETSIGCRADPALTASIIETDCHVCDTDVCNAGPSIGNHHFGFSLISFWLTLLLTSYLTSTHDYTYRIAASIEPGWREQ